MRHTFLYVSMINALIDNTNENISIYDNINMNSNTLIKFIYKTVVTEYMDNSDENEALEFSIIVRNTTVFESTILFNSTFIVNPY